MLVDVELDRTGAGVGDLPPVAGEAGVAVHPGAHLQRPASRGCPVTHPLDPPAALDNAIEDALAPFGVEVREQHLPPSRIVELCGFSSPRIP